MKKEEEDEISKQTISLRIQKKLASGLVNKNTIKTFLSENHLRMLENLYKLLKDENNKKEAKIFVNRVIKIVCKLFILQKNSKLSNEEINGLEKLTTHLQKIAKSAITFWSDSSMFEKDYFIDELKSCEEILMALATKHL
ncbi:hypothetical protein MXB_1968, partial [Myxobolus squamalis]